MGFSNMWLINALIFYKFFEHMIDYIPTEVHEFQFLNILTNNGYY